MTVRQLTQYVKGFSHSNILIGVITASRVLTNQEFPEILKKKKPLSCRHVLALGEYQFLKKIVKLKTDLETTHTYFLMTGGARARFRLKKRKFPAGMHDEPD